jgi:hypothetical protein
MTPQIALSYRRSDAAAMTGRICDQLIARYGEGVVFLDIDAIPVAVDFRAYIRNVWQRSDVLLAIVGPAWRGETADGARIDNPDDPVRVEVELALAAGLTIVPVLVDGARMPAATALPPSLAPFAFLNAATIDTGRDFHHHCGQLIDALDDLLGRTYPLPARPGLLRPWWRRPHLWGLAGALALPPVAAAGSLTPPWPPAVVVLTVVSQVTSFALASQRLAVVTRGTASRVAVGLAIGLGVLACMYLLSVSRYTYQTPTTKERWAAGFVCTADARAVFGDKCPNLGIDELRSAEYEAERLWTRESITIVRVGLVVLWLVAFILLSAMIASLGAR